MCLLRNNAPAAVMMPVSVYEAIMDELDDLRVELAACDRLKTFDRSRAISHEEMKKRFADADGNIGVASSPSTK